MRAIRNLLVICLALGLGAGELCGQGTAGGVISGRVTGTGGQPQNLLIRLMSEGDIPAGEMYTDSNGTFSFRSLPNGTYWVEAQATGYKPVRQTVVLDLRINPLMVVNLSLEPVNSEARGGEETIAGSSGNRILKSRHAGPAPSFDGKALSEFNKGSKLEREGKLAAAAEHYQTALKVSPSFYPALNNLGAIYLRQKDLAGAKQAFLRSLELNPDDGEAHINLGHALYEEGRYLAAIERLEEGLKRSPESAVGHFFLGSAYLKLGDLGKAERDLKLAYSLDPHGMAPAELQLANLYLRRHDTEAARAELENYLRANPSDPQAPAIKKMLASLKSH